MENEKENEQPQKKMRDIYSRDVLVDLLLRARFVDVLKTEKHVATHNFLMEIIQEAIGKDGEKYIKFLSGIAMQILSL